MSSILSKVGVKPEMVFHCCDCDDVVTGEQVIAGDYLYIVKANRENPIESVFRCECCHDEYLERFTDD
jgi:hypothetical protein